MAIGWLPALDRRCLLVARQGSIGASGTCSISMRRFGRMVVLPHAALCIAHVLEPLVTPLRQLVQQLEAQAAQAHDLSQH